MRAPHLQFAYAPDAVAVTRRIRLMVQTLTSRLIPTELPAMADATLDLADSTTLRRHLVRELASFGSYRMARSIVTPTSRMVLSNASRQVAPLQIGILKISTYLFLDK